MSFSLAFTDKFESSISSISLLICSSLISIRIFLLFLTVIESILAWVLKIAFSSRGSITRSSNKFLDRGIGLPVKQSTTTTFNDQAGLFKTYDKTNYPDQKLLKYAVKKKNGAFKYSSNCFASLLFEDLHSKLKLITDLQLMTRGPYRIPATT